MMKLDHDSPIPLRVQVEQLLDALARKPQYRDGALLPDELTLARTLGVSRGTVRSGISKLVFQGLLERKAGVGTRVASPQAESGIRAWHSFTREMEAKGITVQNFRLDYRQIEASKTAARALLLETSTPLWRVERIRGWGDKPVLASWSWFHPRLGLKGVENFDHPLYQVLEAATGAKPHHAREEFTAVSADASMARMLQVERKAPLLLRCHTVYDAGSRPIEFAEVYYVSSRFTLTLDMKRGDR